MPPAANPLRPRQESRQPYRFGLQNLIPVRPQGLPELRRSPNNCAPFSMQVFVFGSFDLEHIQAESIKEFGRHLGWELAMAGHTIIAVSSRLSVVDRYILEGANDSETGAHVIVSRTEAHGYPFDESLFPNLRFRFHINPGQLNNAHIRALSLADMVLTYHGNHPLDLEIGYQSLVMDKPILAIPSFDGAARQIWEERAAPLYQARGLMNRKDLATMYGDRGTPSPKWIIEVLSSLHTVWKSTLARQVKAFICHAKEDRDKALIIYDELVRRNVDPWIDEKELFPGQDWDRAIQNAIVRSDVILILLSQRSVMKRGYVQKEIRRALEAAQSIPDGKVFVIPVRLEEVELPISLQQWQAADFTSTAFYQSLLRGIQSAST